MTTNKSSRRLYVVNDGEKDYLVEAVTQAQAIRLIVGTRYTARPASAYDVAQIAGSEFQKATNRSK